MLRTVALGAVLTANAVAWAAPVKAEPVTSVPQQSATPRATALTLDEARRRAIEDSPTTTIGELRVREIESRRADAAIPVRDNPVIGGELGPRVVSTQHTTDVMPRGRVEISFQFDLGGGRAARLGGVDASVARTVAENDDARRRLVRDVSVAFTRVLWANERIALAENLEASSKTLLRAAEEKLDAGGVSRFAVNAARAELSKRTAEKKSLEGEQRSAALGELKSLLGIDASEEVDPVGDIRVSRDLVLDTLLARAHTRADLRALDAEEREANADVDLADSLAWPKLGVGAAYEHEETGVEAFLGTMSLSLPFFDRSQGLRDGGLAKRTRARSERNLTARSIDTSVRAAFDVWKKHCEAVDALEAGGVADFEENVALGQKGFEAGALEVMSLMRELDDARAQYVDELLARATAAFDAELAAGDAAR